MNVLQRIAGLGLGATFLLGVTSASAQPVGGDRAVELGSQGIELYKAEKWAECVAKFDAASALVHSPVFDLYKARCLRGEGRLLKARALLESVAREKLAPDAPAPWKTAVVEAATDRAAIQSEVPSVIVTLGPSDGEPVTIDGQNVSPGGEVELDPGLHKLGFTRDGKAETTTFELGRGERRKVVPSPAANAGVVTPPDNRPGAKIVVPPPPPAPTEATPGSIVPGAILTAVGGAAIVVGGIFGGLALSKYGEIDEACPNLRCGSPGELDTMNGVRGDADTFADASTGLLISGGVVAAVGIVLMIVRPGGTDGEGAASNPPWVVRF